MNELHAMLSMCRKAGKLVWGFDSVKNTVLSRSASLVILCKDLSAKTVKEMQFVCAKQGAKTLLANITMNQMDYMIGKKTGVIAICEENLANRVEQLVAATEGGNERI